MTPVPVDSPEDFRRRLSLALLRLERDPISIPAAKINRMLPRLCDRVPQLNDFSNSLNAAAFVYLYVLYGSEQQQHKSCVERLICRKILNQKPASELKLIAPMRDDHRVIEWPTAVSDAPKIVFNRLRQHFCRVINENYYFRPSDDAAKFVQLAASMGVPYLVFRHPLLAAALERAREVIALYLEFWCEAAATIKTLQNAFRVVVFFEVIAPEPLAVVRPLLDSLFKPSDQDDGQPCIRLILPELSNVGANEIAAWWTAYSGYVTPKFSELGMAGNCPDTSMAMLTVESTIAKIIGL